MEPTRVQAKAAIVFDEFDDSDGIADALDKALPLNLKDISVAENFDLDDLEGEEIIDEAEDTITILSKYVQSLEIENKNELDSLMKSLYNESLTMETI